MASPAAQAIGFPVLDHSFTAGADMSSNSSVGGPGPNGSFQYCAVKMTTADLTVAPCTSAYTKNVLGVLQTQPNSSQAATVRLLGITKLVVDGSTQAIIPGMTLSTDTSARGVSSSSAAPYFAVALQNSTAQNDIISVFLNSIPQ